MKTLKLVPTKTEIGFVRHHLMAFALSALFILGSVATLVGNGLNFGIDFRGGTLIEVSASDDIDIAALRSRLNAMELGEVQIQLFGAPNDALIRVAEAPDAVSAQSDLNNVARIRANLEQDFEIRRVEIVGPQVSRELIESGLTAVLAAIVTMLIYIWFRFEWQFSIGAV